MKLGTKVRVKGNSNIGELVGVVNWKYVFSQQKTLYFSNKHFGEDIAIVFYDEPIETYPYEKFKNDYLMLKQPEVKEELLRYSHKLQCYSAYQYIPYKQLEKVK